MSFTDGDDAEPLGFSFHASELERDDFDFELGDEAEGKITLEYGLERFLDEDDLLDDDVDEIEVEDDDEDEEDDEDDEDDEDGDEDELLLDRDDGLDFYEEED